MTLIRLGAVDYLNARPLVYGLDRRTDLFSLRFDVPSLCAVLLHDGAIDVGMIPSIEYRRGATQYMIVPGLGIVSNGAVASVALFSQQPLEHITSIAVDTSSRTSAALLEVLCHEAFGIAPALVARPPAIAEMLRRCDAALVIGDPALYFDHAAAGLLKVDLGERWTEMTGLPFVWAFWAGRPGILSGEALAALVAARDAGVAQSDEIAADYCGPELADLGRSYLRENIQYGLGEREEAGLRRFYDLAEKHRIIEAGLAPSFYGA